jgi:hypothetical protein
MTPAPRVCLRYNAALDEVDTFRLRDDGRGITLRLKVGGVEYASELELRWRSRLARQWPEAVFFKPVDAEGGCWLTMPATLGGGLLRRELQLERVPEHVSALMFAW